MDDKTVRAAGFQQDLRRLQRFHWGWGEGGGTYGITVVIQDAKSRSVDVDMFVAGSAVPLTHGQRAVSQGHVVFEGEALA